MEALNIAAAEQHETKRRRSHVTKACQNCQKSHVSCDSTRPCKRCIERNKECVDGEAKRRGRKKFPDGSPSNETPQTPDIATPTKPNNSIIPTLPLYTLPCDSKFGTNMSGEMDFLSQPVPEFSENYGDFFLFTPFAGMETAVSTKLAIDPQPTVQRPGAEPNETPSTFTRADFFAKLQERLRKRLPEKLSMLSSEAAANYREQLVKLRESLKPEAVAEIMRTFDMYVRMFGNLFDQLGIPSLIWERSGIIHYANKSYIDFTGFNLPLPTALDLFAFHEQLSDEGLRGYIDGMFQIFLSIADSYTFRTGIKLQSCTGYIEGVMCVTVKRDLYGLPLVYIGNFLPCAFNK